EERAALAARAQQGFERALPLERSAFRRHLQLCHIAQTAALAHAHERARDAAEQVLREAHEHESTWQYGNSIHHANIALGHVAFDQGDVHEAGLKLLAAGATRGSPQLDSYGPDLCLASRLLGLGERTVVVRYLRACGRFWAQPERLGGWIRRIESGELTVLDDDEDEDAAGEPGKEDGSA
ncbi:MAG TPA: hypothetical protein VFZ61_27780, partial [Polyangiales bacterium]